MGLDNRHHYYHIIDENKTKWSTDWTQFSGFSYLPILTEAEEFLFANYDMNEWHVWMQRNWHYSIHLAIIYLLLLPILKFSVKVRGKSFNLDKQFFVWNSIMATFSVLGVVRCLPHFIDILWHKGFTSSFTESHYYADLRLDLWYLLFVLSKAPELIDTIFLILQNRNLLTLHWVHHSLTMVYSWYVFGDVPATAQWMVTVNFLTHSLTYIYFALKYLNIKLKYVNLFVILVEIIQMIFGLYINYSVVQMKINGLPCDLSLSVAIWGFLVYGLFFVLFIRLFVDVFKKYKTD